MKTSQLSYLLALMVCLISVWGNHTLAQEKKDETTTLTEQRKTEEQKKAKAVELSQKAQEFRNLKKWKEAISEYEKALKLQPQSSFLHHMLGITYYNNAQREKGWVELRKAVILEPTNQLAVTDFLKVWNYYDHQGLLNVGTPQAEVLKLLGNPDQKRDQKDESQWRYGFQWIHLRKGKLYALVDTRGLTADLTQALSRMEFQVPPHWRVGFRVLNVNNALTEYVTGEETVQNYQQLFSTHRLLKWGERHSARETMNRIKASHEKKQTLKMWNVIQDGENDILFEWRSVKYENTPAQHSIVRLIKDKRDVHRLAYSSRKLPLSDASRAEWIKLLRSAKLIVAHPGETNLTATQKKELAKQLTKKSREIIALQLQYIQNLDVKSMQPYFTERIRILITTASLKKAKQQAASAKVEELVHSIQIEGSGDQLQAKIKMKNGRTLTTLVPVNGKWEADTIWFK